MIADSGVAVSWEGEAGNGSVPFGTGNLTAALSDVESLPVKLCR
jgi:hypothetical protein